MSTLVANNEEPNEMPLNTVDRPDITVENYIAQKI